MVAELGGAQREAGVGSWRGHVGVRRGRRRGEGRLELVGQVGVAGLVVRVDGRGGQEPVCGMSMVVVVGADAQGYLVNYSASLWVGETIAVLEERGRRARGQDGMGVVGGAEGPTGTVGQQGVGGQGLGVGVLGGRGVRGAAVRQVSEGVCVDSGGNVGMRSQRPIVAVPLFAAVV